MWETRKNTVDGLKCSKCRSRQIEVVQLRSEGKDDELEKIVEALSGEREEKKEEKEESEVEMPIEQFLEEAEEVESVHRYQVKIYAEPDVLTYYARAKARGFPYDFSTFVNLCVKRLMQLMGVYTVVIETKGVNWVEFLVEGRM